MEAITSTQCAAGAWRDGLNAVRSRPLLYLVIFVMSLVVGFVNYHAMQGIGLSRLAGKAPPPSPWMTLAYGLAVVQAYAFSMIGMHAIRHVVLGATVAEANPVQVNWQVRRYFWTNCQIGLITVPLLIIAITMLILGRFTRFGGSTRAVLLTVGLLLCLAAIYVAIRLWLIAAQVALGRPKRWGLAWRDTRGHFWSIWGAFALTVLPFVGIAIVLAILWGIFRRWLEPEDMAFSAIVLRSVLATLFVSVLAALHGWMYRRYADNLLGVDGALPATTGTI